MQEKSGIKKLITAMLIAGCCLLTVAFPHVFGRRGYYLAAFIYAVMAIGSVLLSFENRNTAPLKLAVLAVMPGSLLPLLTKERSSRWSMSSST